MSSPRPTNGVIAVPRASRRVNSRCPVTWYTEIGVSKPLRLHLPRSRYSNLSAASSRVTSDTTTAFGGAMACRRAAKIGRFANNSVLVDGALCSHVTHDNQASRNADPDPHVQISKLLQTQPSDGSHELEPGENGSFGSIFVRYGIAEVDENAVSRILRDVSAIEADRSNACLVIGGDQIAKVLGIEPDRQTDRILEITEQEGQLSPFGSVRQYGSSGRGGTHDLGLSSVLSALRCRPCAC